MTESAISREAKEIVAKAMKLVQEIEAGCADMIDGVCSPAFYVGKDRRDKGRAELEAFLLRSFEDRSAVSSSNEVEKGWVALADSEWVNIVNAPSVLDPLKDKEEAVREAVKLTEAKLRDLNTVASVSSSQAAPQDAIDARRYRWLRGRSPGEIAHVVLRDGEDLDYPAWEMAVDAAIDAELAASPTPSSAQKGEA